MRYIELNPVAAGMVTNTQQYRWSSYLCNAKGEANSLITPHPIYQALGNGQPRLNAYMALFGAHQDATDEADAKIRSSLQTGTPLGNDRFQAQIEKTLGQIAGQSRRGRPSGYVMKEESKLAIGKAIKAAQNARQSNTGGVKGL